MANRLKVVWGEHVFSFLDLTFLLTAYKIMRRAELVGDVVSASAYRHVQNLLKFKNLQSQLTALRLIEALNLSSFAKSTDIRDKVYGLIGLTYDGSIIFPTPSYERDINDINTEATLRVIRLQRSLDHVVFRSIGPGPWLIDWFDSNTWSDSRALSYLSGMTKFYTHPGLYSKWAASGSSHPSVTVQGRHLVVKSIVMDMIRACSATFEERRMKSELPPGLKRRRKKHRIYNALFWCFRLYQSDRVRRANSDSFEANDFYSGIRFALAEAISDDDQNETTAILQWLNCPMNSSFTICGRDLRKWFGPRPRRWFEWSTLEKQSNARLAVPTAAKALKMGMRLGETVNGSVGWFTKYAKPGDAVAILQGSSVPVILRPLQDGEYMVVGDSIICGMMLGEVVSNREWSDIKLC
jgi:hypothetical protein